MPNHSHLLVCSLINQSHKASHLEQIMEKYDETVGLLLSFIRLYFFPTEESIVLFPSIIIFSQLLSLKWYIRLNYTLLCLIVVGGLNWFYSIFTLTIILLGYPIFIKICSHTTPFCLLEPPNFMIKKMNK